MGQGQRQVYKINAASFSDFDAALEKRSTNLEDQLKLEIEFHLQRLKEEFEWYFLDMSGTELPVLKMTRNPFSTIEDILPDNLQEKFLEMKCNSTAKDDIERKPLTRFF